MKYERINGHTIDLDKVSNIEYLEETYILKIVYKVFLLFTKTHLIRGVSQEDYERIYRIWDSHRKTVIPKLIK